MLAIVNKKSVGYSQQEAFMSDLKKGLKLDFYTGTALGVALGPALALLPSEQTPPVLAFFILGCFVLLLVRPYNSTRLAYVGLAVGFIVSAGIFSQPLPVNEQKVANIVPYTEKDFYWDKLTTPWKKTIIDGVNRVRRDNPLCAQLDPSSAYVSANKGTKKDPVFFVTCEPEGKPVFNHFFSKSDVDQGRPMVAARHIPIATAKKLCEDYAKSQAQNPQTVDYSYVIDNQVIETPNGRTRILSSFTASNLMGVKQKFKVDCLFDAKGFIEGAVTASN
jgi:hypothetical protein